MHISIGAILLKRKKLKYFYARLISDLLFFFFRGQLQELYPVLLQLIIYAFEPQMICGSSFLYHRNMLICKDFLRHSHTDIFLEEIRKLSSENANWWKKESERQFEPNIMPLISFNSIAKMNQAACHVPQRKKYLFVSLPT
ncbi:hypothetical protein RIR_jg374.t1 [Rhizophagus irregularis DAOM 181602=DAOM 197198]|nr:hypothetical protein RIR_jg374.t1 [Rhizophagus irregularis DAOM 181602=DAOM 197198]